MAHSPKPAPAGKVRVAGYLIERPIASGANGTVYRAIDERLGRRVALKVLSESASLQARERFLREVRMIAGLQHPNVVLLYGAGDDGGISWAAMELMAASLSQELHQRGRFSTGDLRAVVRDACRGLDAVSKRGIMHRDVKPSNLLRSEDGTIKVADFGLARDLSLEVNLPAGELLFGTPWYMSPEQAAGQAAGVASDLYSLGATLYHLAAGRPPFASANALDVIVGHALEPVPPLPDDIPPSMSRLISWLLEKDSASRPAGYQAVLEAVDDDDRTLADTPTGGLGVSVIAAAHAALQLGRGKRVRSLLEPVVRARGRDWVRAGFLLARAMEHSHAVREATQILDDIAAHAGCNEERALALWNLGRLAEKEEGPGRAIEMYSRIKDIPSLRLPTALLDARIARLRNRGADPATPPA